MQPIKFLKKDRVRFEKEVNAYFDTISYLKPKRVASDAFEDYRYIKTKYGVDYEIRCVEGGEPNTLLNVMGAFCGEREDYARIRDDGIDCNPFTGKWNFHLMYSEGTPSDCVDAAVAHIKRWFEIIREKPNVNC